MHRESLPLPQKRQLSFGSSPKFFHIVDAIAKYHEPTQTQLDALESSYSATGQYVMESDEFRELTMTVHAQGSRAIGTIIRPTQWRPEGFDIDVVIRLRREAFTKYGGEQGAVSLINDLFVVLKRYAERHSLAITKWERCITLEYAGGMKADITPIVEDPLISCFYGDTHARVPDRKLQLYEPSNPRGLVSSFNEAAQTRAVFTTTTMDSLSLAEARADMVPLPDAAEVLNRLLSRLVQLLKLHRNMAFGAPKASEDFAPKSVFLTTLAGAAYTLRAPIAHDSPLDLLLDVVETMPLCFERQQLSGGREYWSLPNLTAPGDNLADSMNTPGHQLAFSQWHGRLIGHLQQLLQCIEQRSGLDSMLRVVEEAFGSRAALAVREAEEPRPVIKNDRRVVVLGTAAGTTLAMPARSNTFYGK